MWSPGRVFNFSSTPGWMRSKSAWGLARGARGRGSKPKGAARPQGCWGTAGGGRGGAGAGSRAHWRLHAIDDGGISGPADMVIALALGADTLMMGNVLARFTESPGKAIRNTAGGWVKEYW